MQKWKEDKNLIQQTEVALRDIPRPTLRAFLDKLVPVGNSSGIYESILNKITLTLQVKESRGMSKSQIIDEIISKSEEFSLPLKESLTKLLKSNFLDRLELRPLQRNKTTAINPEPTKRKETKHKGNRQNQSSSKIDLSARKETPSSSKEGQVINGSVEDSLNIEIEDCPAVNDGACLCQKIISPNQQKIFKCVHCGYTFHEICMMRSSPQSTKQCLPCHLKYILPNRPVRKTLFLGVLKKYKKNHGFLLKLSEQDLKSKAKLQIRCFRIKQSTNSVILFPDYAKVEVNGTVVKEFTPLHKQSSLKYRKDEPVTLELKDSKEIRVKISLDLPTKESHEERIEHADHLIAFYLIEEKSVPVLCKEIAESCISTCQESQELLNSNLRGDSQSQAEEITMEMQRIPLVCPISSEKIKIPVRGLFCRHFQCFDLYNFLIVVSSATNPRWFCPLCKRPAYQMRVDCILSAIIAENNERMQSPKEVTFFRNGDYSTSSQLCSPLSARKSIYSLDISSLLKRKGELLAELVPPRPQRRQTVICLDD